MKKLYIKDRTRRKELFQFFMHDFIDACKDAGIGDVKEILPSYRFHIRAIIRDLLLFTYKIAHSLCPRLFRRREALIVTANGVTLLDSVFPYYGSYEIIPFFWDVWPSTWERMYRGLELLEVRTLFVTSRQVVNMINKETNMHAYWIPEGINEKLYYKGESLFNRKFDIFEMGRRMPRYHDIIKVLQLEGKIKAVPPCNLNVNGTLNDRHVIYTNEELYHVMSETKIMVCFPQCDTNPARAGNIETLTLRYWEAMLSRCIMVGRAPQELKDLIGYDPVIELDWDRAQRQLYEILSCVDKYQNIVDHNYKIAKQYAPWNIRIPQMIRLLRMEGYTI